MTGANPITGVGEAVYQSRRARESKKQAGWFAYMNRFAVISVYLCSSVVSRLGFCGVIR
jgi:hypothetical protein